LPERTGDKICFVIAPIGHPQSDIRRRSDQVLRHIIRPAASECGYICVRADEISEPGLITSQIIQHVIEDPLVIADLTGQNPNVFYELALRHAVKKPFVHIIEVNDSIPFDVGGMRTVFVDHHDMDSVEQCRDGLVQQIRAIEARPDEVQTPISIAVDLQQLRRSDNPLEKSNAEILEAVRLLTTMTETIYRTVRRGSPEPLEPSHPEPLPNSDYQEMRAVLRRLVKEGKISTSALAEFSTDHTSVAFDSWVDSLFKEARHEEEAPP
jgi:hypothetical protein